MARFEAVFFYKSTISPIFRAKWNMWRVSRQNCLAQKLQSFFPKTLPKSFFRKIRFRSELFYETASPIFGAKWTMWRISRKNRHGRKFHSLCIKHHEQSFRSEQFCLETRDTIHLGQKISEGAVL
jgi:hypothetical protein